MGKLKYEEMLPHELAAARQAAPLVYFPIGSLEYHGFHLPMGFDAMHAYAHCLQAAAQTGGVVLPPTYWGFRGHEGFPGSLLVNQETIASLARDVLRLLTSQGYRLIVVMTGHWPDVQGALLAELGEEHMAANPGVRVMVVDPFNLHPTDRHAEHAGAIETSAMLHLRPDLVEMQRLAEPGALQSISADCVEATTEAGRQRFEEILAELVRAVKEALSAISQTAD